MEASTVRATPGLSRVAGGSRILRLRSDEQLVALFRSGSDDAFTVLHDRYRQRLFTYVRQMLTAGTRADAEDLLQDVFVRAYSSLRADDRPMAARAWLYRVAHNRCIDALRHPAPVPTELPELAATDLNDPLVEAARREELARLVTDLRRLPEQQRSALLMRELEGLSYAELAEALGCTLSAVKSLLVRARMGLAEAVEARDAACIEIRSDLAETCERGVRSTARARRHMHDCDGCRAYRETLRGTARGLGSLAPSPGPLAALLKLLGLGGSGAAAGGGAVGGGLAGGGILGGGGAAGIAAGGGAVAATATKMAVVVCCVAGVAGGAREIERQVAERAPADSRAATARPAAAQSAPVAAAAREAAPASQQPRATKTEPAEAKPPPAVETVTPAADAAPAETTQAESTEANGGIAAPDEPDEIAAGSGDPPAEGKPDPAAGGETQEAGEGAGSGVGSEASVAAGASAAGEPVTTGEPAAASAAPPG